jgi:tripartite-type tricarboxylate transporter receptor subunit TctC
MIRSKKPGLRLLVLMLGLLLVLAACDDDGDDAADDAPDADAGDASDGDAEGDDPDDDTETGDEDANDEVADFYSGNTIEMVVGFGGGQFDVRARVLAEHMPRHMPGNPNIIVENMPGAGSMAGANHLYNVADNDGTVIGTFLSGLINQEILENPGVEYEMSEFQWLFAGAEERGVCIARTDSGVTTLEDILPPSSEEVVLGYTGPGSPSLDYGIFFSEVLGGNVDFVGGYDGNAETRLGVERGDVDGYCVVYGTAVAEHQDWEEAGEPEFEYFAHVSLEPMDDELPNATYVYELVEDDIDRQVFELMVAQNRVFFPFAAPPGVPEERVQALRQAIEDTLADPEYQAAAEEAGLSGEPVRGEDVQAFMEEIAETPDEVLARFRELFAE